MIPPIAGVQLLDVLPRGLTVAGDYLPAGVNVATTIYSIQYAMELSDPFHWRRERWLDENCPSSEIDKRHISQRDPHVAWVNDLQERN